MQVKGDSINNEKIAIIGSGQKFEAFDFAIGDFDGDGYSEIALIFSKRGSNPAWSVSVRIYKINDLK